MKEYFKFFGKVGSTLLKTGAKTGVKTGAKVVAKTGVKTATKVGSYSKVVLKNTLKGAKTVAAKTKIITPYAKKALDFAIKHKKITIGAIGIGTLATYCAINDIGPDEALGEIIGYTGSFGANLMGNFLLGLANGLGIDFKNLMIIIYIVIGIIIISFISYIYFR